MSTNQEYEAKIALEREFYKDYTNVHDLPPIFHYWSNQHLLPLMHLCDLASPDDLFVKYLSESARRCGTQRARFVSIGAGNCDTEIRVAQGLKAIDGTQDFVIECLELNQDMLARGRAAAAEAGLARHLEFVQGDFNQWAPSVRYDGVMASQSLHHVLNLEGLFLAVRGSMRAEAYFVVNDVIGRNGHQRWPEALQALQEFWKEMPAKYRYNRLLSRYEETYENWDCSTEGFEGIRAQDILGLLLQLFEFRFFCGFGNVIDVFTDRAFGHNFDAEAEWDRDFIDRIHAYDERGFREGTLTPTHMLAVMCKDSPSERMFARGLSPIKSLRLPEPAAGISQTVQTPHKPTLKT